MIHVVAVCPVVVVVDANGTVMAGRAIAPKVRAPIAPAPRARRRPFFLPPSKIREKSLINHENLHGPF